MRKRSDVRVAPFPRFHVEVMSGNCPSRTHPRGIVYWNTIYIQLGLDALPGRPADDELAGLMPTIFARVDALGIYTFDADRRAGQPGRYAPRELPLTQSAAFAQLDRRPLLGRHEGHVGDPTSAAKSSSTCG